MTFKLTKMLNKVKKIIDSKKYLSTENALNLGVILIYAPRNQVKEISKTIINLY